MIVDADDACSVPLAFMFSRSVIWVVKVLEQCILGSQGRVVSCIAA